MFNIVALTGYPGETAKVTLSDTAQTLTDLSIALSHPTTSKPIVGVLISCETNDARFCVGGETPTQAGVGHILAANSQVLLVDTQMCRTIELINKTNSSNSILQITPLYEY